MCEILNMPKILAVSKSKEQWSAYLCHAGKGGSSETNYYREDYINDLLNQQAEVCAIKACEWLCIEEDFEKSEIYNVIRNSRIKP